MHSHTIQKLRGSYAVVFYDEEGKRRRYSLSAKKKKDATAEAVEVVEQFFKTDPAQIKIREIIEKYVESLGNRVSGRRLKSAKAMINYFGSYKPSQINHSIVETYIDTRRNLKTGEPVSAETLWTELGGLRDALSFARKYKLIPADEIPYIQRPSKPEPRNLPLDRSDVKKLLKASESTPHLYIAILLLLGTAGRTTAVLELEWSRIDFKKNIIDLRLIGNGPRKGRAVVPMNPGLRKALLVWKEKSSCTHVVSFNERPVSSIKTAFNTALKKAKLENVRLHDIRHTSAVWMLQAGSSISRISQYLGHSSEHQTQKVYARYQPDFLRAEAESLDVSDLISWDLLGIHDEHCSTSVSTFVRASATEVALVVDAVMDPDLARYLTENGQFVIENIQKLQQRDCFAR